MKIGFKHIIGRALLGMALNMTAVEAANSENEPNGTEDSNMNTDTVQEQVETNGNFVTDLVGGYDITSISPIFDHEDKNIIVASELQIVYYDVKTHEQAGKAYLRSSKLNPEERIASTDRLDNTMYVFTNDGGIFMWNLETRDWINELTLPLTNNETLLSCRVLSKRQYIYSILDSQTNTATIYFSMSRSEREKPKQKIPIGECNLSEQRTFDIGCFTAHCDIESESPSNQRKSSKQKCLAFIYGPHLYYNKVTTGEKYVQDLTHQRIQDQEFTCIRVNPQTPMIAAGDTLGRIYVYTGDFTDEKKVNRTKLHWHSLPVNDICFSSTGNTLFSVGGESGCVAIWELAKNNLSKKHVVARLGMPIRYVSCSNNLNQLALSFEDNEIQLMNTSYQTKQFKTLTRRTIDMYEQNDSKALRLTSLPKKPDAGRKSIGILWHSPTDTVITNGKTGWLQFYSPKSNTRIDALNFLKTTVLSLESKARVIPSDITKATVTLDGEWLAFYETRKSEESFPDVKLHIWQRSSVTNRWVWIQTADRLHSSTDIADLKFSPDGMFLVSVCEDGTFHVLHRVCLDSKANSKNRKMYVKGFFGNVPSNVAAMAAFSQDSSVMALSLLNGSTLIWMIADPYKLVYECQLNHVSVETNGTPIQQSGTKSLHKVLGLHFGYHKPVESLAPLCEVRSNSVRIWNILNSEEPMEFSTVDLPRSQDQPVEFTSAAFDQCPGDSRSFDHFAVCTKNNLILIFRLHIAQTTRKLCPLIVVDAGCPYSAPRSNSFCVNMCFLAKPILDIDEQCHSDPNMVKILNRLCLMNDRQELIAISDKLTLERQSASNSCNSIKTIDKTELQAYFAKSATSYEVEARDQMNSNKIDPNLMTEKQRRIRKRLEVQKMIKDLLVRIPSQNLPRMEILGPMILDKLI